MAAPLNIILIDDHPLLRLGVAGYINQAEGLTMSAQMANAAELREWLSAGNKADVALLDRSLPDADGLDLVSEVRDAGIKVIMLTIADSDEEISEAIAAGVDGYVVKSSDPEQVIAAIRSVCDGQSSFPRTRQGRPFQQGHRLQAQPVGKHRAQPPAQHHGKAGSEEPRAGRHPGAEGRPQASLKQSFASTALTPLRNGTTKTCLTRRLRSSPDCVACRRRYPSAAPRGRKASAV